MVYIAQTVFASNDIQHHGIKGQKWGQQNGPPYPLNAVKHSLYEKLELYDNAMNAFYMNGYRKQGYTKRESESMASGMTRATKVMLAGGVALAAVGGSYMLYRYVNQNMDTVIKSGTELQRITTTPDEATLDRIYVAHKKGDLKKYSGIYADELTSRSSNVYKKVMNSNDTIKVAGINSSKKIYKELVKNGTIKGYDSYSEFNTYGLTRRDKQSIKYAEAFYKALRDKGYGGVIDVHDSRQSGYNTISPVIVFNTVNIKTKSVSKLSNDTINTNKRKAYKQLLGENIVKTYSLYGVTAATSAGLVSKVAMDKYREEPEQKRNKKRRV